MTTPTAPDTSPTDTRPATGRDYARTLGIVGALFVALIGIAGAISVADSRDPLAGGLAVIAAVGAVTVAVTAVRDLRTQGVPARRAR
jgi:hypothetical protein